MTAVWSSLVACVWLWAFWSLYVLVMGVYRAHLSGRLSRVGYVLGLPWVVLGYVVDAVSQYTLATLLFCDLPRRSEHLVTDRLTRYCDGLPGWRRTVAVWVCTHLLDVFDPRGDHC